MKLLKKKEKKNLNQKEKLLLNKKKLLNYVNSILRVGWKKFKINLMKVIKKTFNGKNKEKMNYLVLRMSKKMKNDQNENKLISQFF